MGLDVYVFALEDLASPIASDILCDVDELAAAVVPLGGIAFGVLVGEDGTHGLEDGFGDEVFRRDHLEVIGEAAFFVGYRFGDFGIYFVERAINR
jgi:hypothetical protein